MIFLLQSTLRLTALGAIRRDAEVSRRGKLKNYIGKFLALLLVLNVNAIQPAMAQHLNASDAVCKGISVTSDLVACLEAASKTTDSKLNETYSRIQSVLALRKDDLKNLVEAERAWIHFRDLTCDAEYRLFGGGSGGPAAKLACMEALTRNRNSDLLATYGWLLDKFGK